MELMEDGALWLVVDFNSGLWEGFLRGGLLGLGQLLLLSRFFEHVVEEVGDEGAQDQEN